MIKTVILDMGGTLVESPDLFMGLTQHFSKYANDNNNLYDCIKNNFMKRYRGISSDEMKFVSIEDIICNTMAEIFQEMKYSDIREYSKRIFYETYLYKTSLYDDTIELLDYLQNKKIHILLASDADSELMHLEFQKFNLSKYFDRCFISEEIKAYKPSWSFVEKIKRELSYNPDEAIFVGDSDVDIYTGKRLGVYTVLKSEKKTDSINPDYVISKLKQLKDIIYEIEH